MIRAAVEADVPRLIEMGERFHRESHYSKHLAPNAAQFDVLARKIVADGGVLVIDRDGELVGMIGYFIFPHFLSAEIIAGEVFWWIEPGCRGEGRELLKAAESRAKTAGAQKMQMIAPNPRVGKLYERAGYSYVESAYQKTL